MRKSVSRPMHFEYVINLAEALRCNWIYEADERIEELDIAYRALMAVAEKRELAAFDRALISITEDLIELFNDVRQMDNVVEVLIKRRMQRAA